MDNICLMSDSYKFSHWKQYPPKTEKVYSYFESRVGAKFDRTVFFGLQYFLEKYLMGRPVTQEKIDYAEGRVNAHMGEGTFYRAGWEHILNKHNGRLPVEIKAVPEGTAIPTDNVLMTIENTDPACYWLPNFLETLLVQVWYPSTVATQSAKMRQIIQGYLNTTGYDSPDYKMHDFGFRGVTCPEQAGLGGAAHLLSFSGTDNFAGIELLKTHYREEMAGHSIPASEHSTITSWGKEGELDAYRNMLEQYPEGTVACVSDSYNLWDAVSKLWGGALHDQIMGRKGTLVVRPDSGTPHVVVLKLLGLLGESFGFKVNGKGYKTLDSHVRIIQGDGIDLETMNTILFNMEVAGWSADNIAFGSGGGLLQKLNRDTQRFAFKCAETTREGVARPVYKDPVTDQSKASKMGRLKPVRNHFGRYETVAESAAGYDEMKTVFFNGVAKSEKFSEMRKRLLVPEMEMEYV